MNHLKSIFATVVSVFALLIGASAQQQGTQTLSSTTLASAVSSSSVNIVNLASATGVTASAAVQTTLLVDNEQMDVALNGISGTFITVTRGAHGTKAVPHASGRTVFIGRPNSFRNYTGTLNLEYRIPFPDSGGTAYTSLNTNGTTLAATTMYCTEINLVQPKVLTGLGLLNGTTAGGTDKHLVVLYDAAGNFEASSAAAGAATSGASSYQTFAFTSPYLALAGQHFGCFQTNGTTDTVRMIVTGTQDTYLTKGVTSITFGTIPASIAVPTSFTTAVGPYVIVY